ncbi:MAG: DUF2378 family protein [Myxococcota bacterium]|nr:DUF2378 family protein [Myxococcota bacterium]
MARPLCTRPETPLVGSVDAEARFDRFPSDFAIKGMFLSRVVQLAPASVFDAVRPRLVRAPALGRYLPFSDYPQVDFSRLAHAVAVDRFRTVDATQAMRLLARHDIATFATSRVGRIMLGLAQDAKGALLKLPEMYAAALRGGSVEASALEDGRIALRFRDFYGWVDCYPVGTVEGLADHFGVRCEIELELHSELAATYLVSLRAT